MKNQEAKLYQDSTVVADVVSFTLPAETRASINVSTLDTPEAMEYEPADMTEISDVDVVVRFRPENGLFVTDSENQTYKLELALNKDATIPYSLEFQGHISEAGQGVTILTNNQEMVQQTLKIKVSGKPVEIKES